VPASCWARWAWGNRLRLRPTKLSTGKCQRVAIARALANEPALLLADEPTASLDAENGQSVMRLITRLAQDRGVTLVIVTHDKPESSPYGPTGSSSWRTGG